MRFRRRSTAIVMGLTLVAAPATSAAAPGEPGRPQLPQAAYTTDLPSPPAPPASRGPARTSSEPAPARVPAHRVPSAIGASVYVDGCQDTAGDAFDVRRTAMVMSDDGSEAAFTLRVCDADALSSFDQQTVVWQTATTSTPTRSHSFSVTRTTGGEFILHYDDVPKGAWEVGLAATQPAPGVDELIAIVPASALELPPTCSPTNSVGCLRVSVTSFDSGDVAQDTMPDKDAPTPVWPSRCRPDIDPATTGHVRLTTTSTVSARAVEAELLQAGYRADAYEDAPLVEVLVGATPDVVDILDQWAEVTDVTPVTPRRATAVTPDDPEYDQQWYLPRIDLPRAWETTRGSDVGIAIVDNGVATGRPDLEGRVAAGWDGMTNQELPAGTHSDLGGHGTAVAALAAATGDDGAGMAGVDWGAGIHPVRVFDHEGCFVSEDNYLRALRWLRDQKPGVIDVANFSLGGSEISGEAELIREIVANGTTVVAAMGNQGDRTGVMPSFPAALPEVVAVGATGGPDDLLAAYSNQGRHVDVVAPGGEIKGDASSAILTLADPVVVGPSYPYAPLAGTSFSTPLVSGLAALYVGEHPDATPADVTRALVTTAEDLGEENTLAGFDIGYGFGMVDAPRVLAHEPGQTMVRVAGEDRYETAARTSQHAFPEPALVDVVLLATGENYPDALAGGPLAAREHAPVLLTPSDRLHEATAAALEHFDPERVLLLGGPTALSPAIADQLAADYQVERAAGEDRYATAATIALGHPGSSWRAWNASDVVYLATGENFPDALPGGAAAAAFDAPLLLTARYALPEPTVEALQNLRPSRVIVLGGPTAVDDDVVAQLVDLGVSVARAAGETRYETAVAALCPIVQLCQLDTRFAVVATGEGFADALGGSAAAAALRAPLVLVPGAGDLPAIVEDAMAVVEPEQMIVLGGPVPIPDDVADRVRQLAVE